MSDPVVVVGAGLAGMAAAARLAKAGHQVIVVEKAPVAGGRWAGPASAEGRATDHAPAVLSFPAPWRDLFRKSGRPLEAELARAGYELAPAPPLRISFADGRDLTLPTDRGGQFTALGQAYSDEVATRWRDLLDRLDEVWQTLRPLGLELQRPATRLPRAVQDRLLHRRTIADLAEGIGHPPLAALIRSVAYRQGSLPEQTPAFVAVELATARSFGRWQVQSTRTPLTDTGRSSVLVEALVERLRTRRVDLRVGTRVPRVTPLPTGGYEVHVEPEDPEADAAPIRAAAVVLTVDPWTAADLVDRRTQIMPSRRLRRLRPARAPTVSHELTDAGGRAVGEHLILAADGTPIVDYHRLVVGGQLRSRHDFTQAHRQPGFGVAWSGFAGWRHRPPVTTRHPGLFTAGPFSPGGPTPSAVLLSGALASYATHDWLGDRADAPPPDGHPRD